MKRHEALVRVLNQPPQEEKLAQADVVIDTSGSLDQTYQQVKRAWQECTRGEDEVVDDRVTIRPANPRDVDALVVFINQAQQGAPEINRLQLLESFGERGYMLVEMGGELHAVAGWNTEDFIARIREIIISPADLQGTVGKALLEAVCQSAHDLMCEVALLFLSVDVSSQAKDFFHSCGFIETALDDLIPAWRKAAKESMPEGSLVMVRKLREKRVMRPV